MQAIEFVSKAHDGVVDLPIEHQGWNGKQVRVILLDATSETTKRKPSFEVATISTRGYRFNRDAANDLKHSSTPTSWCTSIRVTNPEKRPQHSQEPSKRKYDE